MSILSSIYSFFSKEMNNVKNTNVNSKEYFIENNCESVIIENGYDFVILPKNPIELEKMTIINLGEKTIRIHAFEKNAKIYNPFFSPTGKKEILLQKNNTFVFFFVKKSNNELFWFCN